VFSQSKLMIDIIQRVLAEFGMASCRIDGSVVGRERQRIIDSFNRGGNDDDSDDERGYSGPDICLLTTRACGYGITLTGADRVIVFDPRYGALRGAYI
jgi:SNF2 family DNA or RNA helicase